MIPIFIGYDPRESAVFHVLVQSILEQSSVPVSIIPLHTSMLNGFDGQQDGTNAFIYSRFLVPYLMDYDGWAIYMDSDMMFRADPADLWSLRYPENAVMCVHHDYETKAERKYIGTPLESPNGDYPRKNWSSLILWNCGHPQNRILTREYVAEAGGQILHRFSWLSDKQVGHVSPEWNHLVGEYSRDRDAKNVHFTLGAPGFCYYSGCDYANEWQKHLISVNRMLGEEPVEMLKRSQNV